MCRMLLHACCGPCSMYPVDLLLSEGIDLDLYWFNPNIHPQFEYDRRLDNLSIAARHFGVDLQIEGFCEEWYWKSKEYQSKFDSRCLMCYDRRLEAAARAAAEGEYDCFSTTLLVSPYQQHDVIAEIGREKGELYGVDFEYRDFRPGFRQGQQMARDIGLYRQKYCGCCFSLDESEFKDKILKSFEE